MRRLIVILAVLMTTLGVSAQDMSLGSKTPDLSSLKWLTEPVETPRRTTLVEFFHSSNSSCTERIELLRDIATAHADELNVVLVVRDDDALAQRILIELRENYYVALASPRTLRSWGVRYVPYAYVSCPKRRCVWCGNPKFLKYDTIRTLISEGKYYDRPLRKAASSRTRK